MESSRLLYRLKFAIDYSDIVENNKRFTSHGKKTKLNDREENIASLELP